MPTLSLGNKRFTLAGKQAAVVALMVRERCKLTGNELQVVGGQDWRKRISEVRDILDCTCHKGDCQAEVHIKNETVPGETYDRYWIAKNKTQDETEKLVRDVFNPPKVVDTVVKELPKPVDAVRPLSEIKAEIRQKIADALERHRRVDVPVQR